MQFPDQYNVERALIAIIVVLKEGQGTHGNIFRCINYIFILIIKLNFSKNI